MQPAVTNGEGNKRKPLPYRLIERLVRRFFPKYRLYGTENLPEEPCILVGNHSQIYGPLVAELYMPRPHSTWCVGEMMNRKEVPAYAFRDFWSMKPRRLRWFYRLLSYLIAPLASFVLSNAHTTPVYRDTRILSTFRISVGHLQAGTDLVIFPECAQPYHPVLCRFQEHFADLGPLYYRKTGTAVRFVPMYIAPRLRSVYFGEPVQYRPEASAEEERTRICETLAESIIRLAAALPAHTVVPYLNIPKSRYPLNRS